MIARMGMGIVSYADLQQWPEDGHQYELYDGEVRVVPSATNRHQLVLARLFEALRAFERSRGGLVLFAPSDVVFNQYNVLQPDLLYFTQTRKHLVQLDTPTDVSPDLTIEILSPSTSTHDRTRKQAMYARFGVREYWVVDPVDETIEIFVLERASYRVAQMVGRYDTASSPSIDGLAVDTSQIFDIS
jgi:Uma2 family endonuclease